ncbi:DUF2267 domain-containing protein [Streptomyces sp. NBC_00683]|uniref:DUF2267 domain-containing protein n=1 Tax=Streptomyces sp. NBC_00683 TaxID=2903670 RepID=UPI002E319AFF|nr:DUF2267 domain-containing protein [Streptomyces sp. NBC_00683]
MSETTFSSFDTMVDKANRLLRDIEEANGWPKERRKQSYAALRAVLHRLRDRLSVDGAVHLGAQLPTLIRGVYYDGWKPSGTPVKLSGEDFFQRVRDDFPYAVDGGIEKVVRTVLEALKRYVSEGEWDHLKSGLPNSLAAVLP